MSGDTPMKSRSPAKTTSRCGTWMKVSPGECAPSTLCMASLCVALSAPAPPSDRVATRSSYTLLARVLRVTSSKWNGAKNSAARSLPRRARAWSRSPVGITASAARSAKRGSPPGASSAHTSLPRLILSANSSGFGALSIMSAVFLCATTPNLPRAAITSAPHTWSMSPCVNRSHRASALSTSTIPSYASLMRAVRRASVAVSTTLNVPAPSSTISPPLDQHHEPVGCVKAYTRTGLSSSGAISCPPQIHG
mmetsp:Transcript_11779/g.49625  ORF Transcript_11779/g.49625 Transcript_11779/m.49625 type:complete len:251 (+) Transcript_11779:447-1199(+)